MFLDIAFGAIAALLVGHFAHVGVEPGFVAFGVVATLLPDIDFPFYLFNKYVLRRDVRDHRSVTHYPLFWVLPLALAFRYLDHPHAALFATGILFHLVHDSFFLGWGIAWGWPFSKRRIQFFPAEHGAISHTFMRTWLPERKKELLEKYDDPHWIRNHYMRLGIVAIIEYGAFIAALLVLYRFGFD